MGTRITIRTERIAGDCSQGAPPGIATIAYEKLPNEELWIRHAGGSWERANLFQVIGKPDANERGQFQTMVSADDALEAGIFARGAGPTTAIPIAIDRATATATCCELPLPDAGNDDPAPP